MKDFFKEYAGFLVALAVAIVTVVLFAVLGLDVLHNVLFRNFAIFVVVNIIGFLLQKQMIHAIVLLIDITYWVMFLLLGVKLIYTACNAILIIPFAIFYICVIVMTVNFDKNVA